MLNTMPIEILIDRYERSRSAHTPDAALLRSELERRVLCDREQGLLPIARGGVQYTVNAVHELVRCKTRGRWKSGAYKQASFAPARIVNTRNLNAAAFAD